MYVPIKPIERRIPNLVYWKKPEVGWIKLDLDGCSRGNPSDAGAGGVLRTHEGKLLYAFAISVGSGMNNFAKMMGLLHGLR